MLKCSVRGVEKGYPLNIKAETVENIPAEFNAGELAPAVVFQYQVHIVIDNSVVCASFVVVSSKMADRINWAALRSACRDLGLTDLEEVGDFTSAGYASAEKPASGEHVFQAAVSDVAAVKEADLRALHHVLFEVHLQEGELVCPESGRRFFVREGIPNMLLHEDELGSNEAVGATADSAEASK
jgi:uncharacterized protein YbaR (Trm112 family)